LKRVLDVIFLKAERRRKRVRPLFLLSSLFTGGLPMSMVVSSVGQVKATDGQFNFSRPFETVKAAPREIEIRKTAHDTKNLDESIRELQKISDMMGREIRFNVNRDTDRVVIKIVDPVTDRVIKEIPSADVQKLQSRIKEIVGALFDEML
jgi:flagellar protein FlaG